MKTETKTAPDISALIQSVGRPHSSTTFTRLTADYLQSQIEIHPTIAGQKSAKSSLFQSISNLFKENF
jgi:hypothetical protein